MFFNRKPKPIDATDGASIIMELIKHATEHNLTEQQCTALGLVASKADKSDTTVADMMTLVGRVRHILVQWKSTMITEHQFIADNLMSDIDQSEGLLGVDTKYFGRDSLSLWFGLTRANFLCWPRVMLHQMPDAWQERLAHLAEEFDEKWCNVPDGALDFTIRQTGNGGRMAALHPALPNYRYPHHDTLAVWARQSINDYEGFCKAVASMGVSVTPTELANALASVPEARDEQVEGTPPFTWQMVDSVVDVLRPTPKGPSK